MALHAKVVYSSGHGKYLPGACANGYKEHVLAETLVNKIYTYHNKVGTAYKFHDNYSTSVSANIQRIVNYHNSKSRTLDVSVHFNAGGGTGTECLYYSTNNKDLSKKVSNAIATTLGIKDRGAKSRTDLGFLKRTKKDSILIEICFIDSKTDMEKYMKKVDAVAKAIVKAITGKTVPSTTNKKTTTTTKATGTTHTVVAGDTLYSIAKKYNTTVDKIKSLNNLTTNTLSIGQKIIVSGSVTTHTVVSGDTLYSIAKKYGTTVAKIKEWNNLKSDTLTIGTKLVVKK